MDLNSRDFVPIPIQDFVQGVSVPVDLHIRLGEEKFILIAKAGSAANVSQFANYQNREVLYVWVRKKEYYKLAHQSISMAGLALGKRDLADTHKTTLVAFAARSMFRQFDHLGMDLEMYNSARQVTDALVSLVDSHVVLSALFASLGGVSDQLVAHSIAVSALSVMVGQELGFTKKITLEKLAIGGLLHDIGLKTIPPEIATKPVAAMSHEEVEIYETHSFKGMQMLQSLGIVPDDVVSIVYEHHENSIGQGFPSRLRDVKMHPLAKIIALTDAYSNLILPNVNCPVPKNPREALMYIEHTLGIPFNRDAFRALKRIIETEKAVA